MNELISHIEFLLHEHNCVIIPDFGGFVVNMIPSRRDSISTFLAPSSELVFNRDLTHNDGLLAESYMKSDHLIFEAAMQRIERAVEELKQQLREKRHVDLGKLGSFTMIDEKRFMYTPANFVRPAFFGLNKATLKPLIQLQTTAVPDRDGEREKRFHNVGFGAVAAVIILVVMILLPVSDTKREYQAAQMISNTPFFKYKTPQISRPNNLSGVHTVGAKGAKSILSATSTAAVNHADPAEPDLSRQELTEDGMRYYVVVGVFKSPNMAQKMMETLSNEGFTQRGTLQRPGRIDVYAASFTDRTEATSFLREIHKQHPTHSDAWILKH